MIERNGKKGVRFAASRAEAGRGRSLERWLVDKEGKRGDPPRLRAKLRPNGEVRKRRAKEDGGLRRGDVRFFLSRVDGVRVVSPLRLRLVALLPAVPRLD